MNDKEKKWCVALAVALIDHTYERVGNSQSAENGHFGVTGWKVKHIHVGKDTATLRYVGKSGVKHEKTIKDLLLLKAIKKALKGKKPEDALCGGITAEDVNAYLEPFDVTAKDLRGMHANREMQDQLRAVRKKGPKLPADKKEKEKMLKAEFKEALEATAEAVGHEPSTLRTQYLVPGLEDTYMKDGTVNDKLRDAASRVASAWFRRAEREFDVDGLSVQEIQAVLRGAGLGVSGSRQVLVARLNALLDVRELFRGKTDEEVAAELTVPRLRDVFRSLGLHVSGSKPSLVTRLRNMANRVVVPKAPRKKDYITFYVLWENPATGRTEALSSSSSQAQAERTSAAMGGRLHNVMVAASKHLNLGELKLWVSTTPAPDADGDFLEMLYEVARLEESAMGPAFGGDSQRLQEIARQIEQAKSRFRFAAEPYLEDVLVRGKLPKTSLRYGSVRRVAFAWLMARVNLPSRVWVDADVRDLDEEQRGEIWEIFNSTYAKIGLAYSNVQSLLADHETLWCINADEDKEIDAFIAYKRTRAGQKMTFMGSNGSSEAKMAMLWQAATLIRQQGWYAEASHQVAKLLDRAGISPIDDEDVVRQVLGKDLEWLGDGRYQRTIPGVGSVVKGLYGHPNVRQHSRRATRSPSEKEEAEVERLVRPSPKKKPPRTDRQRNQVDTEDAEERDRDLSMNYKDVGG